MALLYLVRYQTMMYQGLKQSHTALTEMRWLVLAETVTVLVVEDETLIRLAIVDELELAGFQVLEADTADRAIAVIEDHPQVQLIFTDIDMPGTMDGLKLAAFVRDRWPPIKIIVTSGRVIPDAGSLPDEVPFFTKPYEFDRVIKTIRAAISG